MSLESRLNFEKVISLVSSRFVGKINLDESINASIQDMGKISGASRVSLFQFGKEKSFITETNQWNDQNIDTQFENFKTLHIDTISWWFKQVEKFSYIHIRDVVDLPSEAMAVKKLMNFHDIKSFLAFPIKINRELNGFICLSKVHEKISWKGKDFALLRMFAEILENSMERLLAEKSLRKSRELLRATFEATADGIIATNKKGLLTHINARFAYMWRIPDYLIEQKDFKMIIASILDQLKDPEKFLSKVEDLQKTSKDAYDMIFFKDGRVFEQYSCPMFREDKKVGRVWSFKNITEHQHAEQALRESEKNYKKLNIELEQKVEQRTKQLHHLNQKLEEKMEELKIKENRFRKIIEYNVNSMIVVDRSKIMHFVNPAALKFFGKKHSEIIGYELKYPIINDTNTEIKVVRGNNSVAIGIMHAVNIDWDGKKAYLLTIQDITEHKIAEQKLKKTEEDYRNLVENISDTIIEVELGDKFEYVSPQFYNIFGFTPKEAVGLKFSSHVHPDDFNKFLNAFNEAIRSKERISIEYRALHKDGHEFPVSLRGNIFEEENKFKLIGLVGDITEKKLVERELKKLEQSLEELDALIETAPLAIIIVHPKGRVLRINEEAENLLNYTKEDLLNLEIFQIFNCEDLEKIRWHYNKDIYNLSSSNKIETSVKTKEGKIIDVEVTSTILKIANKFIIQSFFSDITERKNFEKHRELLLDQLLTSLEFKSKFLANISHELRTPLNAILGFSSLLLEDSYGETNENQKEFLSDIFSAGNHLLILINRVLDLSKIEAGKLKLDFERVNLTLILTEIKSTVKPLYEKKRLSFNIEGLNNSAYLSADPIRFKQILYNLLDNAIKFTEKGNVKLRCLEKKDHWEFQIKDTGIGIAQEDFEVVFREYGRVENDKTKQVPGSGLGLALTKRLINLHGGDIWFESKLGKGTTFYFTIPNRSLTG